MKNLKKLSVITVLSLGSLTIPMPGYAAVAVIVNTANTNTLDQAQIRNIYMGKLKTFPSGEKIVPVDIATGDKARADFLEHVLRKSESNMNSYWARMVFSSKGKPPKELASQEEVIRYVANNPQAIGYVDAASVNSSVKVLMKVE